jgi:pentatricopeptide repeat protein
VGINPSQQVLTRTLYEAMHKEILTKPYSLDCTELSKVMKTGHFNCVSATVLFNCLAEKAGLNVCAIETKGHALSRVKFTEGVAMDLETTCPTWFDLQNDKERQMATLERVAVPVPAKSDPATAQNAVSATPEPAVELPSEYREISPVQLVATIYYNIGVDLHAKTCNPEAAAANIKALYLDKNNEQAWTNLLVSMNNWALDVASEKMGQRYDVATILLDIGVALDPTYANFRSNYVYVFHHWIKGLAELGRFDDARKVFTLANVEERVPQNKHLQDLIDSVNQSEAKIKQSRGQ